MSFDSRALKGPRLRTRGADSATRTRPPADPPNPVPCALRALGAHLGDVDGVERGGAADEQAVALGAAETDIGHHLRHLDLAEQRPVGRVAVHAVAGTGPQVAVRVE